MLRFTIRDMLLLTAIFALALGWAIDRSRLARANYELTTHLNRLADTKAQLVIQRELLQGKLQQVHSEGNVSP